MEIGPSATRKSKAKPLIADTIRSRDGEEVVDKELLGAEVIHVLSDAAEASGFLDSHEELAEVLSGANVLIAPLFLREGVSDLKEGIEDRDIFQVLHGVEHLSLGSSALLEGASELLSALRASHPVLSGILRSVAPLTGVLGSVHGALELILGVRELDQGVKEGDRRGALEGLSGVVLGGAMLAAALTPSPVSAVAMVVALGMKLASLSIDKLRRGGEHHEGS